MTGSGFAEALWQDMRYGLRMLRKSPGFTAIAVLTLALGIGANTAIFSLIDALMLKALPVQNPQELVLLRWSAHKSPNFHSSSSYGDCVSRIGGENASSCSFSLPFFNEMRKQTNLFSSITAFGGAIQLNLSGNGPATMVRGHLISGNYFETLGVRPALGRMLAASDETPGAPPAVVLNYGYWQRVFGGDPSVVGRVIGLNGVQATIAGVAESRFVGLTPGSVYDLYLPISLRPSLLPTWTPGRDDAGSVWLVIVGRMKQGVSREQAQAAVSLLFRNELIHGAKPLAKEEDGVALNLVPAQTGLVGARRQYSTSLYIMMLAAGIILVIACANVAGLLLSRSAARKKEMALRLALGAGRWRIIRQLLTESLLLSLLGGALGILVAYWGAHAILAFVASSSTRPLGFTATIDARMLMFTFGVAIFTAMLFGLAPALRGVRVDLTPALKEGTGSSVGAGRARSLWFNVGNSLVVAQVALTMVVLVGAGLLVRTLQNLKNIDPGFDVNNVLTFSVDPTLIGYKDAKVDALIRDLSVRLGALPGVKSVSYSESALLAGSLSRTSFPFTGVTGKTDVDMDTLPVGPGFFATMKIPILHGRDFAAGDVALASEIDAPEKKDDKSNVPRASRPPLPMIVNEAFVRDYIKSGDPLGQILGRDEKHNGYVVIGLVGNARYNSLRRDVYPTGYTPSEGDGVTFELRTAMNPTAIIPSVRNVVVQTDSNLPIFQMKTEIQGIDQLLFQERIMARLSTIFGLLALVLACVGLYGLLSYEVTRRTREIGIRMALGAQQWNVLRIVILQGLALAAVGAAFGIGAAIGVTRYLSTLLYDVKPGDPITLIATAAILLVVAMVACFVPARRATQVDPMIALRNE